MGIWLEGSDFFEEGSGIKTPQTPTTRPLQVGEVTIVHGSYQESARPEEVDLGSLAMTENHLEGRESCVLPPGLLPILHSNSTIGPA